MTKINERAVRAGYSETEFEALISEYRPFIASCVYKTAGKHTDTHDDAMSIAMIAFEEAIRRYDPCSGNFLAFAGNVIRCRLIDQMRKNRNAARVISLDSYVREDAAKDRRRDRVQYEFLSQKPQSRYDDPVKLEVDELSSALQEYGLRFADVARCSPKAQKTKAACRKAARLLSGEPGLLEELRRTGQLPARQIEQITGISRKTMARHRSYIMCLAEILAGEYTYLARYAHCDEEGNDR